MLFRHSSKPRHGFTLIELAIVMGVIGVVTAGLWRLSATSNAQSKDQATAQQQLALIAAVRAYLADTTAEGGSTIYLTTPGGAAFTLPIPGACPGTAGTPAATFCTYLSSGFTSSTTNPYGQSYSVQVIPGPTAANQGYSFMIMTTGGSTIPDADGGRIANLIGGDGGFLYTSGSVCAMGAAPAACGALGAWSIASVVTTYKFAAAAAKGGHVASQSFVASQSGLDSNWLARVVLDSGTPPVYNTMKTDMYMGNDSAGNSTGIYFPGSVLPSGGVYGGTAGAIHLGGGYIDNDNVGIGYPGAGGAQGQIYLTQPRPTAFDDIQHTSPLIYLTTGCTLNTPGYEAPLTPPGKHEIVCAPALQISGDINLVGATYSTNIITSSDARLKKDIRPIQNAVDDLMKVDAVSFTFKDSGKKSMGVTAQNLQKTYPDLVAPGNGGMLYVEYNGLIGPLIAAVHELKGQNDDLRAQLAAQSARIDKLEAQEKAP